MSATIDIEGALKKMPRGLTKARALELCRTMMRCRRFDERVQELFQSGEIKGTVHSSVGQEAVAAGMTAALESKDFLVSHHRGHGHCIAKGASCERMMAELFGRVDGYCKGLGGSMHVAALDLNILGANGIVGAGIGIGTGAALSARLRHNGQVGVSVFGDGASNEGVFHESLNLAAIWKLPIIFLCENNQYGLSTASADVTAGSDIASRAAGYAISGVRIDGNDVFAVYSAMRKAVTTARDGKGPSLIEARTYRWGDHSMRANLPRYRNEDEERDWMLRRDPIARLQAYLQDKGWLGAGEAEQMQQEVNAELEAAIEFARGSAEPTRNILPPAVYAPPVQVLEPEERHSARELTFTQALNEAIAQEMEHDPSVFVLGEDVGKIGGIFGVTRGLTEKFGSERLRDTPISEQAIAGAAVGAALTGMRPIAEIQIFDFVTLMMDMIVNQAAKVRFMLGGEPTCPVVFRGAQGGGTRLGAQHSQSLEAWFAHVAGLTVVAPSNPYDAKGLLITAIRSNNPVVFLEHKLLYLANAAPVPEAPYAIPFGSADVKREGSDCTVVATMAMVESALSAARKLERDGISVEVIDPRTLSPLDDETIVESVKKTNRLVVAHEALRRCGVGAEIAATISEKAFDFLDAPVARVGAPDIPMPYNDRLEREVIPSPADIAEAVRSVCYRA